MLRERWPLLLGLLVLTVPTIVNLGRETWSTEIGAHGPIVLATGLWLLGQQVGEMRAMRTQPFAGYIAVGLAAALGLYIFGHAYDFISLEVAGLYGVGLVIMYRLYGARALWRNFFPFLYLAFLIPIPGWIIDQATVPLRAFVSHVATEGLHALGYPIMREGVAIFIAQYQLLVEDACSGMNSIIGLTAVTLFYIYIMHKASWRYSLLLMAFIVPVAIFVNILRVCALILLTYYAGDGVAQGFLHVTTGILLFALALIMTFLIDMVFQAIIGIRNKRMAA